MSIRFVVAAALAMSAPLDAQRLNYPTRGVPRTPDGKPNLSAPAPRTPSELLDYHCNDNEKSAPHMVGK